MGQTIPGVNANSSVQSAGKSTQQLYNSYMQDLPGLTNVTNQQQTPTAQAQLGAYQSTMPGYSAIDQQLLAQYGPAAAGVGQQIANANSLAGAQTNVNLLNGPGAQAAQGGANLLAQTNPNYWNTLQSSLGQAGNLVNAVNLSGLSPGESNAVERSLNQTNSATGNLGLVNPTNTIANALNFGGAYNAKLGVLGNALGAANSTTQGSLSGYNPMNLALGTSQTNQGTTFSNPTMGNTNNPSVPSTPLTLGSNLLGGLGTLANTNLSGQQKNDYANSVQGWASSFGGNNVFAGGSGGGASSCCFIFLEAQNGKMPWFVRQCRDFYYEQEPTVATGYKRMAKWLVPLMRKIAIVKWLVNRVMVTPLTLYGGYLKEVPGYEDGYKYKIFKKFWFSIWRKVGK